jgi:hypothetical protein
VDAVSRALDYKPADPVGAAKKKKKTEPQMHADAHR